MIFRETELKGAFLIEPEPIVDDRGLFARLFCMREFEQHGLNGRLVQCNISVNKHAGTLRGMHYQVAPHEEAKLVRCTAGAIYDVIVDLRPSSTTFKRWMAFDLSAEGRLALYVPEGFAHGFQTLRDESEVFYQMSEFYEPKSARGLRWDDQAFNIKWPLPNRYMSERDRGYAPFSPGDPE